jgi:lipoprotein signal peptidase
LLDQSSKYIVFHWLADKPSNEFSVVPGAFKLLAQPSGIRESETGLLARLRTVSSDVLPRVNRGALFSIKLGFVDDDAWIANMVFASVSMIAALAIAYWSTRASTARDLILCAALGLILGGTLGNLYDRVVFHGVRDFLYFYWIEWPVFNVADSCLVCGAFLLLAQAFLTRPVPKSPPVGQTKLPALSIDAK